MAIRSAYLRATKALGRPPQDKNDLIPYLKRGGDPAVFLRSPDDGEDYMILWGLDILNLEPREDGRLPVLAYEQRGKDGMRYVLEVKEIRRQTDEEFKKALFPPGYKAPL